MSSDAVDQEGMCWLGFVALSCALALPLWLTGGRPGEAVPEVLTDSRDGRVYPVVRIGGLNWLGRDLNYATPESFCYDDDARHCERFGRLYRWDDALRACPGGWHLSTERDWQRLERALGMESADIAGEGNRGSGEAIRLKVGGDTGFRVTYGGWRRSEDGRFEALGKNAAWWTATESHPERAWHRDIDTGDDFIYRSAVIKPYALSVRCVQDTLP